MKRIISWNVNGIRAAAKKGLFQWMDATDPPFLCLQETKAQPEQLNEDFLERDSYHVEFASAEKKGYSGVVTYSKEKPVETEVLGVDKFDNEGRTLISHFDDFTLINCYFPNSQAEGARLDYKLDFCDKLKLKADELVKSGRNMVICGDYNIAHKAIDLEHPKANEKNPGYLPEERAWMDYFLDNGWTDSFRMFHAEPKNYSWWSYRANAREKNVGWRIDYHCVNEDFKDKVKEAQIHPDVFGSDHCPVSIDLDL